MWLNGKSVLITGASRGIGRGIALKLAENGAAKIGINYLTNDAAAEETLAKLRAAGAEGFLCKADVTDPVAIQRMFDQVKKECGTLDVLVSNARASAPRASISRPLKSR